MFDSVAGHAISSTFRPRVHASAAAASSWIVRTGMSLDSTLRIVAYEMPDAFARSALLIPSIERASSSVCLCVVMMSPPPNWFWMCLLLYHLLLYQIKRKLSIVLELRHPRSTIGVCLDTSDL